MNKLLLGILAGVFMTNVALADECLDPLGTGQRYCNYIFSKDQVEMITYKYSSVFDPDLNIIKDLLADVYSVPSDPIKSGRPMLIHMHGGGGERTNKGWCGKRGTLRGYVCASIDFRGTGKGGFDNARQRMALSDALAAVRYFRNNAEFFGIDPTKIVLMGVSAGGLTALQANISSNNLDDDYFADDPYLNTNNWGPSSNVCASVTMPGAATDKILGFLDANDAPNYAYHGELDKKINYSQAVKVTNEMNAIGIPSTLKSYPDSGHGIGEHAVETEMDLAPKLYSNVVQGNCPL